MKHDGIGLWNEWKGMRWGIDGTRWNGLGKIDKKG